MDALISEPKSHIDTVAPYFLPSRRALEASTLHGLTLGKYCLLSTAVTLEIFAKHINCSPEKFVGHAFVNILCALFDTFLFHLLK